jgi:septal ring factor EnvC (AmiA/AmiB activator)
VLGLENNSGGNMDEIILLIDNLKKNVYIKFDKVDDDHKNIRDEHSKTRNDIFNIKNELDKNSKQIATNKQNIEQIFILIEELRNNMKFFSETTDKAMKEQLGKIHEYINNKLKE